MTLRLAEERDLGHLVEIARRAWLSAFEAEAPPEFVAHWRAADRAPAWYAAWWPDMLVAEVPGEVVGVVQPKGDEINGLWVDPGWHGRGIGTRLLRAGESVIRGSGHARAWLSCSAFNPRAAGFYRSRGYALERREMMTHRSGVPEELLIFARSLSP